MENLLALNLKNLDKSQWKTYRFDEVAKNISERVDPNNTDLEMYVGLDHIDSESIHLKRSGTPDDVDGQKLRFYPGDVIFGRRRAYQRKAAVATTHGFCSAHALVLRANSEVIDPQLFPFFLHSDLFMNRAVDISVGSLSPTVNWGTLKHQKFIIPPRSYQSELAELLWLQDDCVQSDMKVLENISLTKRSLFNKLHEFKYRSSIYLEDICQKISSGGTPNREKKSEYFDGNIFWVKTKELNDWLISDTEEKITKLGLEKSSAKIYPAGTILLAMYGVTVGRIGIITSEMACNQACCALVVNKAKVDHWFLFYYLIALRPRLIALSIGSAQPNINAGIIKKLKIPNIPLNDQIEFSKKLRLLDETAYLINKKIHQSKLMSSALINKVF